MNKFEQRVKNATALELLYMLEWRLDLDEFDPLFIVKSDERNIILQRLEEELEEQ